MEGKATPCNQVIMESLSDSYGWTPKQIREQRVEDIIAYLEIRDMKETLKKNEMNKQK